jgi:hypothetical protein
VSVYEEMDVDVSPKWTAEPSEEHEFHSGSLILSPHWFGSCCDVAVQVELFLLLTVYEEVDVGVSPKWTAEPPEFVRLDAT